MKQQRGRVSLAGDGGGRTGSVRKKPDPETLGRLIGIKYVENNLRGAEHETSRNERFRQKAFKPNCPFFFFFFFAFLFNPMRLRVYERT